MSQGEVPSGYLDNLPSSREFVLDLVFSPGDHGSVMTPLDPVSCTDDDLARVDVLEIENFLRRRTFGTGILYDDEYLDGNAPPCQKTRLCGIVRGIR